MKDSGTNKKRINEFRKAIRDFYRSGKMKIIIDIEGLTHKEVEKIVYGNVFNAFKKMILYILSAVLYSLPFSGLKILFYRMCGAKIGKNVYFGPAVYLDMMNPSLITIGDNSMIGMHVSIMVHERTMKTLSIGRVTIGKGVTIGGAAIVRHATNIGDDAEVDMLCNVHRSVKRGSRVANQNCREYERDKKI
jgi:acetyltransferase-like isoleucine patch superfamily enzyme